MSSEGLILPGSKVERVNIWLVVGIGIVIIYSNMMMGLHKEDGGLGAGGQIDVKGGGM